MARLVTSGGEIRDHPTSDIGSADGYAAGTAMCASDLSVFRSGKAAIGCSGSASDTSYRIYPFTAPALGASVFARAYLNFAVLPTSTVKVLALTTTAGGVLVSVRLTAAGKLQLFNDVSGVQVGTDSTLDVAAGTWYRLQLRLLINTGAVDQVELLARADDYQATDESVSGSALSIADTHAGQLRVGWIDAPGAVAALTFDDVGVNDSSGTAQNSWLGEGSVVWMPAALQGALIGSWTDCAGGASPIDGVNKVPPVGLADHSTAGHTGVNAHQMRCVVNTAQTITVMLKSFLGAGIPMDYIFQGTSASINAFFGNGATSAARAQSFTPGIDITIGSVGGYLGINGTPTDSMWYEIQSDQAGLPSGAPLWISDPIPASSLSTTMTLTSKPCNLTVAAGTKIWLVVKRTGGIDVSNFFVFGTSSGAVPDGVPAVFNSTTGVWSTGGTNPHGMKLAAVGGVKALRVAMFGVAHGQGVTGVKAGSFQGSTPVSAVTNFNFGDNLAVAGTYPTGWRWTHAVPLYDAVPPLQTSRSTVSITKNSGSGTNACDVCAAGMLVEYAPTPPGWARVQRSSDSTFWQAKQAPSSMTLQTEGAGSVDVEPGDWALFPDPPVPEGSDIPSTLVVVTDDVFQTNYLAA